MPLHRHLSDTAAVAAHLFRHFLPATTRRRIAAALPGGEGDALLLCSWLAGVHDVGKASPAFAVQVGDLFAPMESAGLTAREQVHADRGKCRHELAGMIILDHWLQSAHGWDPFRAKQFSIVLGGHHGQPPEGHQYQAALDRPHLLGWSEVEGVRWRNTQYALLDWVGTATGAIARLPDWGSVKLPQSVQVLLTGLVIMADWIASNEELFPYRTDTVFDPDRVTAALEALDLTAPWRAIEPEPSEDVLTSRFGLPEHYRLRPVQEAALAAATGAPEPGLMIIEAPMGEGKTEAALLAAEVFAARSGAGGCFVALPTRATSDAMFSRLLAWAKRLPDEDAARGHHSVALAHAKAFHNTAFTRLFHRGEPLAIAQDAPEPEQRRELRRRPHPQLIAHRWMADRKRTMFNSFVIGTIDQLLFAALKAKHLSMRHLGLAGKVVVIDEAHAYDVYMGVYLDMALEWLASYGVPVIILSATLPADRRAELVAAYAKGRKGPQPPAGRRYVAPAAPAPDAPELRGDIGYPVIATSGTDGPAEVHPVAASGRSVAVEVRTLGDDHAELVAALRSELDGGGCALVIRNTVRRVQATAAALREAFGPELVTVAHSRFAAPDRASKDAFLVEKFGPPSSDRDRPAKHIVVASQVAEQSLDIDFDVLVTDLAPVDLVLQRMGRLHRHDRPERTRPARCHLTGADWDAAVPEPVRGSVAVYGRWALLRAAAVLLPHLEHRRPVTLPGDIAGLVQDAYGTMDLPPQAWRDAIAGAYEQDRKQWASQRDRATAYRLAPPEAAGNPILGWLRGPPPLDDEESPDGRAMVRDIAVDTIEVLLIARDGSGYTTLPWLGAGAVPLPTAACPGDDLAKTLAATTLSLPMEMARADVIEALEERLPWLDAWQGSKRLAGQLVLDIELHSGLGGRTDLAGFHLDYDRHDGLRVRRL